MGPGSYANGGSFSSFSNLSASAPPFTVVCSVSRPVSTPLVELGQPLYPPVTSSYNWVNSEFDSNSYSYPTSTPRLATDAVMYESPKPYFDYPSYVSHTLAGAGADTSLTLSNQSSYGLLSTSHAATSNGSSHAPQWTGLEDQFADLPQSQPVQLDGSFSLKDNYMNGGFYAPKGFSRCAEASSNFDMVGREKRIESISTELLDLKPFLGENPKFKPYDYPTSSTLACTSVISETFPPVSSLKVVNTGNDQIPNDSTSFMKSSPAVSFRLPAQDTCVVKSVHTGSDEDSKDFSGNNSFTMKNPHPFARTEGKLRFDASQIRFHLQQDDHNFPEFSSTKTEELPTNETVSRDAWDHFVIGKPGNVIGKPGNEFPHINLDAFNFLVDGNDAIDSVVDCSESLDHFNPAVDSPCWKGATVSPCSFEVSEAVTVQNMKRLHLQDPEKFPRTANDVIRISFEKPNENLVHQNHGHLHNHLTSLDGPSVANVLFKEGFDNDESGSCYAKSSHGFAVQISDEIQEPRKEYPLPNKLMDNSDLRPSHIEQHILQEGKWTEKHYSAGISVADFVVNINDDPDDSSCHAMEHVLSSTTSADDACSKLTKSNDGESSSKMHGGESTTKVHVRMLVNTMHNLSELLQFHCSNDACELKEEDFKVLKDVINNLDMCILKNTERKTSSHESLIPERTSALLPELQKGGLEYLHAPKEEHITLSGKKEEKLLSFASVSGAADNITQAIKKILAENCPAEEETQPQVLLYKNLWLEAEASLCSVNYLARFNRMKFEMEKYSSEKANENTMGMENLAMSKVSCDPYTTNIWACSPKGGEPQDNSIPDSSILNTNMAADEVMTRYQILNSWADNCKSLNTSVVQELSSSIVAPDLGKSDNLAHEANDGLMPDISIKEFSVSNTTGQAHDVEASVMARFHILKQRFEDPSFMCMEEHQPDGTDLGCVSPRHCPINEDETKDKISNPHTEPINHATNSTHEKSTVKEFHLFVKDDPVLEPSKTNNRLGDQPHAGWYDSSSSDWEHVLREELSGQDC